MTAAVGRLGGWRDAAVAGRLPRPARTERWQPLRAGVVNLWEFDIAEIWYADGRLQLQGANESGKSTLMTLTTLLLLHGEASGRNIDTLGESGKRFRYYVEPTNHPLDRRDASKQKQRGWAWVEYGRATAAGPEFFTNLLCAEARRTDGDLKLQWCTLHGDRRVRGGLSLREAGLVTEPGQVRDLPGFVVHRTATAYREETARTLFGTEAGWLDQIVRVLRVVRTPKIGDRLDLDFLTESFRRALPPLAEDEVNQLADGWEQLERLRSERDTAEQALAAVAEFTRLRWLPWADAVVRAAADPVTTANDHFDNVTRTERESRQAVTEAGRQVAQADARIGALQREQADTEARRDALQQEQAYQDAVAATTNARHLAERAGEAEQRAERAASRLADAEAGIAPGRAGLAEAERWLATAEQQVTDAAGRVAGAAEPAGLTDATARFLPSHDLARLRHAAHERAQAADGALRLWADHSAAVDRAEAATAAAEQVRGRATASRERADQAGRKVEETITAVAGQLTAWAGTLPAPIQPPNALVEAWVRAVAGITDAASPQPVLARAVAHDHLQPVRRPLEEDRARLAQALADSDAERERTRAELAGVEAEHDPRPREPELWHRRPRPAGVTGDGGPLWRLVEVSPGTDPAALPVLEAALDAAGLLQAWVTPDGAYLPDRDGTDAIWREVTAAAPEPARSLRAVLRPADDAGPLAGTVDRLLRTVSYPDSAPPGGTALAVGRDGSWRHGALAGTAAPTPDGPRLLGSAARAADRARRIAALRERLAGLATRREPVAQRLAGTEQLLDTLDRLDPPPSDGPVVGVVLAYRAAEGQAAADAGAADRADAAARTAQGRVDAAAGAVAAHADEHLLPRRRGEVERVRQAVQTYQAATGELATVLGGVPPARAAAERAATTLAGAESRHRQATADLQTDQAEARRLRTMADAAAAALSQEAQQVLREVEQLGQRHGTLRRELEQARAQREELTERKIRAEVELAQVAQRRQAAETARQAAVRAWFSCVDSGLPRLRGLDPVTPRHLTAALESARAARAAINPREWPRGPDEVSRRVQVRWQQMLEAVLVLRSRLETLGGRSVRTVSPGEGDAVDFPGAVEVVADGSGAAVPPPVAAKSLSRLVSQLATDYDEELTRTIDELLGSTFIEHLRDRLAEAERLRHDINAKLAQHPTTTSGLRLRLQRVPVAEEAAANQVLHNLERDFGLLHTTVQEQIRQFLARRVDEAQEAARAAGEAVWRDRLAEILDYRRWFDLRLEFRARQGGDGARWQPLDRGNHTLLSGGAKVVTLLQPFVAALHAMYDQSGTGPRMLWLDEAFDGVDPANRTTMLGLLTECDLDWLIAGPGPVANAPTVPMAAMYEVRRAPHLQPGVSLDLAVWAGGELTHLATPDPADLPDVAAPVPAPPGDDLLSGLTAIPPG